MARSNRRKKRNPNARQLRPARKSPRASSAPSSSAKTVTASAPSWSSREFFSGHFIHAAIVFVVLLAFYIFTMPRGITYEDAAIFNLTCYNGQPAHPPGYPLYSLLCFPFSHLPLLTPPIAGNLFSALFGAAACALLYLITVGLIHARDNELGGQLGGQLAGYVAGLGYGFSKLFWSQSIISEVYTLHAFLVMAMLLLAVLYERGRNPTHLKWFVAVCGLGMANHWVLSVLTWPILLLLLLPALKEALRYMSRWQNFAVLAGLFVATAALPYIHLLSTNLPAPVNFYGPLKTFDAIVHYISRAGYTGTDNQQISWFDKVLYARFMFTETVSQYGYAFLALAIAGFAVQWRRWRMNVCCAMVVLYLSTSYLLVYLVNFKYNELWTGVFSIYSILAYSVFAIWGALAVHTAADYLRDKLPRLSARAVGGVVTVVGAAFIATVTASNFNFNNRAGDKFAFEYANVILNSFKPDAVAMLSGDFQLPMMELNLLEGVREDVVLFNTSGLFLANRYLNATPDNEKQEREAANFVDITLKQTDRPIYYFRDFKHEYGIEDFCVYKRVRNDWPKGRKQVTVIPELFDLWALSEVKNDDLHFDSRAKRKFRKCLIGMVLEGKGMEDAMRMEWESKLTDGSYYDLVSLLRFISVYHKTPPAGNQLVDLLKRAEEIGDASELLAKDRAALQYAQAYHAVKSTAPGAWKNREAMTPALEALRASLKSYPSAENPSVQALVKAMCGLESPDADEVKKLRSRFPHNKLDEKNIKCNI